MNYGKVEVKAFASKKKSGVQTGIIEVAIEGYGRKYVDITEFRERSGISKLSSVKQINKWLNSELGKEWVIATKHRPIFG